MFWDCLRLWWLAMFFYRSSMCLVRVAYVFIDFDMFKIHHGSSRSDTVCNIINTQAGFIMRCAILASNSKQHSSRSCGSWTPKTLISPGVVLTTIVHPGFITVITFSSRSQIGAHLLTNATVLWCMSETCRKQVITVHHGFITVFCLCVSSQMFWYFLRCLSDVLRCSEMFCIFWYVLIFDLRCSSRCG